jgi:hypothetical protein
MLHEDVVLVNRLAVSLNQYRLGDVVTFWSVYHSKVGIA